MERNQFNNGVMKENEELIKRLQSFEFTMIRNLNDEGFVDVFDVPYIMQFNNIKKYGGYEYGGYLGYALPIINGKPKRVKGKKIRVLEYIVDTLTPTETYHCRLMIKALERSKKVIRVTKYELCD